MSNVDFAKWFLDGTSVDDISDLQAKQSFQQVNETTEQYIITFPPQITNLHILNSSLVTCLGYYDDVDESKFILTGHSQPALLLIQGIRTLQIFILLTHRTDISKCNCSSISVRKCTV